MKKLVTLAMISMLAAVSTLSAGAIRCEAMGNMTSLKDTRNFGTFPQLTVTGAENITVGSEYTGNVLNALDFTNVPTFNAVNGSVRYKMLDNMGLQVMAKVGENTTSIINVANDDTTNVPDYDTAYNRVNLLWSMDMGSGMMAGVGVKFYSNSASYDKSSTPVPVNPATPDIKSEHSMWYTSIRPGLTLPMGGSDLDLAFEFGFGSWEGKRESTTGSYTYDEYKLGHYENDGWMNMAFDARYYMKGDKVDYVPYMNFTYASAGAKADITATNTNEGTISTMGFVAGSGIHLRPIEGINVFNELEFKYSNAKLEDKTSDTNYSDEDTYDQSSFTLLPTYRAGVESIHNLDPKNNWLGVEQLKLWGGFSKSFTNIWSELDNSTNNNNTVTGSNTKDTDWSDNGETCVTFGGALAMSNITVELSSKYDESASKNTVKMDIVYNFKR